MSPSVGRRPRRSGRSTGRDRLRVVVRERVDVAGFGDRGWYVYRDGRVSPFGGDRWWAEPDAARVVIAHDGAYVDASDAALELLGITRADLATARAGDFSSPAHRDNVEWLQQLLLDTGEVHSTTILRRATGEDVDIEYHLEPDSAVPGQWISAFRELPPLD
jgi:PAS domain S-box-containing protein